MDRYVVTSDQISKFSFQIIDYMVMIMTTENPEGKPLSQLFDSKIIDPIFIDLFCNRVPDWATHFYSAAPGHELEKDGIALAKLERISQ